MWTEQQIEAAAAAAAERANGGRFIDPLFYKPEHQAFWKQVVQTALDAAAAMSAAEKPRPWPRYRVGNRDYLHALGVIASVFNRLEFQFRSLFPIYTRIPDRPAYVLFAKITNELRLELIRDAIDFSAHPEEIKEHVRHFLSGFKMCADNRNILMHSTVYYIFGPDDDACPVSAPPGSQPSGMGFQKAPKKGDPYQINSYQLSLTEIRALADSINTFEVYGDSLFLHILKNYETSRYESCCESWGLPKDAQFVLPDKPALPKPLAPLPPDTPRD